MKIETLLHDEIRSELETLSKTELGSDSYRATIEGVTKLLDRSIEIDRLNLEHEDKIENREIETELKLKQLEDERKDRMIKNLLSVIGIAAPLGLTVWGTLRTFKFEETGTVGTMMGRGFISKLLHWK